MFHLEELYHKANDLTEIKDQIESEDSASCDSCGWCGGCGGCWPCGC
jgi:MoaA/NifB/PqqE/SkfB family radical SAM enzyme